MKKRKWLGIGIVSLAVILLAIRVALPYVIQDYVNDRIDQEPGYSGSIGDVDLALFRGAYQIENVRIFQVENSFEQPLFSARLMDLSILWSAIWDGALVGEIRFSQPEIHFIDGQGEQDQTGANDGWIPLIRDLFPMRIDKLAVSEGTVTFVSLVKQPQVDLVLNQVEGSISNLTNSRDLSETLVAQLEATGQLADSAAVTASGAVNPSADKPTFDLNLEMAPLSVNQIKELIAAYAPLDVEGGTVELATEIAVNEGQLSGYVKPGVEGLEIFTWQGDVVEDNDNPLTVLWEGGLDVLGEIFENQETDQLATRIPLAGDLSDPEAGFWPTLVGIFRNAFVEAIRAELEGSVSLGNGDDGDEGEN